jgi:hypothetical protein
LRKFVSIAAVSAAFGLVGTGEALAAPNPSPTGTGLPGQSCGDINVYPGTGRVTSSPGAPFNEVNGIGGANYNETSQYDVACYQASTH